MFLVDLYSIIYKKIIINIIKVILFQIINTITYKITYKQLIMLGEKYIVNGEQVEDLEIIPTENGGYVINFKKIFNIIDAKTIEIIERLKKDDIKCYATRYDKKK